MSRPNLQAIVCLALAVPFAASAAGSLVADAAARGDRPAVKALLQQKADVNAAQGDGSTALHWAATAGDLEMTRMLLAAGANVKAASRIGKITPLVLASQTGNADIIEALLAAGADPNGANDLGTTPLMLAAASGRADAVKALLDHGAQVNARELSHGQTALMFAAALNRDAAVRMLLQRGADPAIATNAVLPGKPGPETPENKPDEEKAGANKKEDAKKEEVKDGAKKEDAKKDDAKKDDAKPRRPRNGPSMIGGQTALLFAARDGQMDAVRALVEGGANVNDVGAGEKMSPMVLAIANGHYDVAKYLLDHGADPNLASTAGLTALYAVLDMEWAPYAWFPEPIITREKTSYLDLMKALLAHGANPNAKLKQKVWFRALSGDKVWVDRNGATPFWRAAEATDLDAMRLLVESGADPNVATDAGVTPLMVAAGLGWSANFSRNAPDSWVKAVQYCMELGNKADAADEKGYTAMHGAAFRGDNDVILALAAKGGRADAMTKAGDSTADMANGIREHSDQHPEAVALLEKLGSSNSHNCRSSKCLITDRTDRKRLE